MSYQEVVVACHQKFYPNGGENLENTRFFANLSLIMASRLSKNVPTSERDIAEMCAQAEQIEKRMKQQYGN